MTDDHVAETDHGTAPEVHKLDGHNRHTLERLFAHPTSHNIQWHDVRSLLEQVGSVKEHPDGKLVVRIGERSETFEPKRSRDMDIEHVMGLRRVLSAAGITPEGAGHP